MGPGDAVRKEPTVSRLGLSLRPLLARPTHASREESALGTLRYAGSLGILVVDASAGSSTETAQEWIGRTARGSGTRPFVLSPIPAEAARAPRPRLAPELAAAAQRLGGAPIDLLLLRTTQLERAEVRSALESARAEGLVRDWGAALPPGPGGRDEAERGLALGVRSFRLPFNLLDRSPAEEILDRIDESGGRAFVTDPHAQGLLDGSLLRSDAPGPGRPFDGPALARRFAPVRELAFLTADRLRTLPEAALQFVLESPGVACALLDVPGPETLPALVRALDRPPLGSAVRRRLPATRPGNEAAGPVRGPVRAAPEGERP